jgi:riboflavin kinase/FMN adenylyltransferase
VYITTLAVGQETFQGVTNVGVRPTFGEASFAVESHLLDFHPIELTEKTALRLTFLRRLRDEERFASPEALREQIARDVTCARRYFSLCNLVV